MNKIQMAGNYPEESIQQMHTGFWWGNLRETDNLEDLGIDRG